MILELALHISQLLVPYLLVTYARAAPVAVRAALPGVKLSLFAGAQMTALCAPQPAHCRETTLHARRASCSRTFSFLLPAFLNQFQPVFLALAFLTMTVLLAQALMICNQAELAEVGTYAPATHHHTPGCILADFWTLGVSSKQKAPS